MWIQTEFPNVLPPPKRILPGRPKKKKRLEAWEMNKNGKHITKYGLTKKCGICKEVGHNRKSCLQQPQSAPPTQSTQPINVGLEQPPPVVTTQSTNIGSEQPPSPPQTQPSQSS